MSTDPHDMGTLQALLDRLGKVRLPRTLHIKERVDAGERLSDFDIAFLKDVLEDANDAQHYVSGRPEFRTLASELVQHYEDIVRKAVENERRAH